MATYEDFANLTKSEKNTLVWIEPSQRALLWTLDSGSIYTRNTNYFVVNVKENGTSLTQAANSSLSSGEWFYDSTNSVLYARASDDSNPQTKTMVVDYRLFFSDIPKNMPHDLNIGSDVEYSGRLNSGGSISFKLDEENSGVALEAKTDVSLNNQDGFFDEIFDKLTFENKRVTIYSWSPSIPLSEKRLLYKGVIEDKSISTSTVKFKCKDDLFKLREPVQAELFSESDGEISDTYLNTPKRRVYGQVEKMRCVPIDSTLDGFTLTGTVSGAADSVTLTGTGTAFLDEVSPEDELILTVGDSEDKVKVQDVVSDTEITLSDAPAFGLADISIKNLPDRPWRKKNRRWHIAGHKLRQPTTTVASATQPNRFTLTDGSDIFAGDIINVDGEDAIVRRINGNDVVLNANLQSGTPSASDPVSKNPLSKAFIGASEAFINRDWTVTNTSTDTILELNNLAEFNIARPITMEGAFVFTNGSRSVTATSVDLRNEVQPRDWIRPSSITDTDFYEVLKVEEGEVTLRINFAGSNFSGSGIKKNVELIDDDALITCNTIGLENSSGEWVKTASDMVKHLLTNDIGAANINTQSFIDADIQAPYIVSYIAPKQIGASGSDQIKSLVTEINQSVFGSLTFDENFDYRYQVVTSERDGDITKIESDDVIGDYSVKTNNNIIRKVNASYRPFVDIFTGEDTFKFYEFENQLVDDLVGTKEEKDVVLYLFEDRFAEIIAQRIAFRNSLSQSVVSIKGKLNLSLRTLGDKVLLSLDRLYKRFGSNSAAKVAIVNSIKKNGNSTNIELTDLGNTFNRNPAISENGADDFTLASSTNKILNGYIVDNTLQVPDTTSEDEIYTQVIG